MTRFLESAFVRLYLPALTVLLILVANTYVFLVVPSEQIMGAVQRIFYFHVGSAFATYVMIGILFAASVAYLSLRDEKWDLAARASGGVAFLVCTIVLATGMIWGRSAWNTWWRWEPRLVSFLFLWLVLFAYVTLRQFTEGKAQQATFAAVLGIIAAVNVPIVIFSIKLLKRTEQLHPEVIAGGGLRDPSFTTALLWAIAAMLSLVFWLFLQRLRQLTLDAHLRGLLLRLRDIEFDARRVS